MSSQLKVLVPSDAVQSLIVACHEDGIAVLESSCRIAYRSNYEKGERERERENRLSKNFQTTGYNIEKGGTANG